MTPSKIYKLSDIYCLTIRQPWAWLIVNGIKDVENRTWKTNRRGMFYIHAAKASSMKDYKLATQMLCEVYGDNHDVLMPPLKNMPHGGIVGSAEIVDCTKETDNPWHFSPETKEIADSLPEYEGKWDGKTEMTLNKLEVITRKLLQ